MNELANYEEQVYAGVLGKVLGVYAGRPFEGWRKQKIQETFGFVDRYVHEERGVPLVVPDDDISGTLTFVRALEDSGLYADTPTEFFGDTWLNYLVEGKTVLWWGGLGISTEHTAYLRLKSGHKAPASGSLERNGPTVAQQIGAQIFIDGFGLVTPGRPELAVELAGRAARVSHDGEAVYAAQVVAALESLAFIEKDMDRLLDTAVSFIPEQCLLAQVHRDVRAWAAEDDDWESTYDRIDEKYGYHQYGGNCHVIPNHALMVMAWAYAPDDFQQALAIVNTAGWDTDCNSANVGCLMGVKLGLAGLNAHYDYQSPTADRVIIPTAEGTRCLSDCLTEAVHLANIGRRVMGWSERQAPKQGAWHHFSLPGAVHGYQAEEDTFEVRDTVAVANVEWPEGSGNRALQLRFRDLSSGKRARVSVPLLARARRGGYGVMSTPRLYPGMTVRLRGQAVDCEEGTTARLFVCSVDPWSDELTRLYSEPAPLTAADGNLEISFALPDTMSQPLERFGIELSGLGRASGTLYVDRVSFAGSPRFRIPLLHPYEGGFPGWIADLHTTRGAFSNDAEPVTHVGKNEGRGVLMTGTTDWEDYTFAARVKVHLADLAGIAVRYQGLQRYLALVKTRDKLQLMRRYYGDEVLAETDCHWPLDELHELRLTCRGETVTAWCDGQQVLQAVEDKLCHGGAGFVFENGLMGFCDLDVS